MYKKIITALLMTGVIMTHAREIDKRQAAVKGIDLEHALNYILASDAGTDFLYDKYTSSRILYTQGSRPALENIVKTVTADAQNQLDGLRKLNAYVLEKLPHASVYMEKTGKKLPPDRALTEEELLVSGYGWCNEQARVFCALSQIYGVPSRMAFIFMPKEGCGHVISEVFLNGDWMAVDQSKNFFFVKDGKGVRAMDAYNNLAMRQYFTPLYEASYAPVRERFSLEILQNCSQMALCKDILSAYTDVGFYNYYLL